MKEQSAMPSTPWPWFTEKVKDGWSVYYDNGSATMTVATADAEANANLISAAPMMLIALESLLQESGPRSHALGCECNQVGYDYLTCFQRLSFIRRAIKQAKGDAS